MASENFLEGVAIVDIADILSYEKIERESNRLFALASAMKVAEIRIAGARIADRLIKGRLNPRDRALLQLRGQVAIEIYEAMLNKIIRHSRMKRMMKVSTAPSTEEVVLFEFTRLKIQT